MGRISTGAITTKGAMRIELSWLIKEGFLKKNAIIIAELSWSNGARIGFQSSWFDNDKWIELSYVHSDHTGNKFNYVYKIHLDVVPSNLGQGEIMYFICPVTGKRARILYKCYGSHKWKCRQAYRTRIYYSCQISSKWDNYNDRYWSLTAKIDKLSETICKTHYRGQPTRILQRYDKLTVTRNRYDDLRWGVFYNRFRKVLK